MLSGQQMKETRKLLGWTQVQSARRLQVSQSYVAMLEAGQRPVNPRLARRVRRVFKLPATAVPLPETFEPSRTVDPQKFAQDLANLGYDPYSHLVVPQRPTKNPAEVLLTGLAQDNLEARALEALPWVLMQVARFDTAWLLRHARLGNLQNRLGYVCDLALAKLGQRAVGESKRRPLEWLRKELEFSLLAREDTLCDAAMPRAMQEWARANRPAAAVHWNLLTTLWMEELPY
jgi:transcriptional regulator with XRE-family HTH domain